MNEFSRPSPVLWELLLPERRRSLIVMLESMALRRIRHAPVIEEISDDERRSHIGAPRPAS